MLKITEVTECCECYKKEVNYRLPCGNYICAECLKEWREDECMDFCCDNCSGENVICALSK